jgi:hypothetical protein
VFEYMQNKYLVLTMIVTIIIVAGILEYTMGTFSGLMFNEMRYNDNSYVLIPANENNGSSLGGYYSVNGSGHNFKMLMILTGGVNDTSSPLDYTSSGLHINGHIDMFKVTPETIIGLYENNFKDAMFDSIFNGNLNMTCSVWNGSSYFENNGHILKGTFTITGKLNDWYGNYTIINTNGRLVLVGSYDYYQVILPENITYVQKTFYL